jgi:hypothetical protein
MYHNQSIITLLTVIKISIIIKIINLISELVDFMFYWPDLY